MNRVSETINKKAITYYNYPNDDKYAPILKFAKYNGLFFEDNSTFIIKLSTSLLRQLSNKKCG